MDFFEQKHAAYFRRFLHGVLPPSLAEADQVRVVMCYFALNALDSSGCLKLNASQRVALTNWIIQSQFCRSGGLQTDFNVACVYAALASLAIIGNDFERVPVDEIMACIARLQFNSSSVPTGCAMSLPAERMHGAVFARLPIPAEVDVRYVYAAVAVCSLLRRWDSFDVVSAVSFICRCQSFEGGFGLCPGQAAHGGSTYCALAALDLMGCAPVPPGRVQACSGSLEAPTSQFHRLSTPFDPSISNACRLVVDTTLDCANLVRWISLRTVSLVSESYLNGPGNAATSGGCDEGAIDHLYDNDPRYRGGLSGRAGKPADACYAWWCGATRLLLQQSTPCIPSADYEGREGPKSSPWPDPWTDDASLAAFLLRCQFDSGGCGKDWEAFPDPLHSCYGVVGASEQCDCVCSSWARFRIYDRLTANFAFLQAYRRCVVSVHGILEPAVSTIII